MNRYSVICEDCLEFLPLLADGCTDTIITDPPYGLEFMGKVWDKDVPVTAVWKACLRVAKPGAFLLAFGGTRTFHRLSCAIEDAGWEIRDCVMWLYGTGFPKSHDIGKATDEAEWEGWGTALKPAWEPIIVAMKPLDGTFAQNAEKHGVAGLNIYGCRIGPGHDDGTGREGEASADRRYTSQGATNFSATPGPRGGSSAGRWPANVILDEQAGEQLDRIVGNRPGCTGPGPVLR